MNNLLVLQNIDKGNAKLPEKYEGAKIALSECYSVDECKVWADKAQALASYAKQAEDTELEDMAKRIRGRAVRRIGILLKEFDGRLNNAKNQTEDTHHLIVSKSEAAEQAGLSERRQKQANNLANIDEVTFEAKIEAPNPPTITELQEAWKKEKEKPLKPGHYEAMYIPYDVEDLAKRIKKSPPPNILIEAMSENGVKMFLSNYKEVKMYLDDLYKQLS